MKKASKANMEDRRWVYVSQLKKSAGRKLKTGGEII